MGNKRQNVTAIISDKRGRILSIGKNSYIKTHPLQARYARRINKHQIYLHAEIQAIIKCRDIERAYKIVVIRYDSQGQPCIAKPCPICSEALRDVGISIIEHT